MDVGYHSIWFGRILVRACSTICAQMSMSMIPRKGIEMYSECVHVRVCVCFHNEKGMHVDASLFVFAYCCERNGNT